MATYDVDTDGGGTYATLALAVADLPSTFSGDNTITLTGATVDTSEATINQIITPYRLTIQGENRTGVWNSSLYSLENARLSGVIIATSGYITFDAVQIHNTFSGAGLYHGLDVEGGPEVIISNCIIKSAGSGGYGIETSQADAVNCKAWNNIIYGFSLSGGHGISAYSSITNEYYNNTVYDCEVGFRASTGTAADLPIFKNNVAIGCTTNYVSDAHTDSSNNAGVSTGATPFGTTNIDMTSDVVADYFNGIADFHLDNTGQYYDELVDVGVSVSGTFTDDIEETSRPQGSFWDIGADEYTPAGGGGTIPVLAGSIYSRMRNG